MACMLLSVGAERKVTVMRLLALTTILLVVGCEQPTAQKKAEERREVDTAAADNTKKNQRDVANDMDTKTPLDQGENETDRNITADIRKAVVAKDGLSTNAKNVKIITNGGVVTLRGAVESEGERDIVSAIARDTKNVTRIDNQLEVTPPNR